MKYFTINEMTRTSHGLNIPNAEQIENLKLLIEKVLDPAREELQAPIKVNSGFRSELVNKEVKGAKNSQHLSGQAADLVCYDNKKLYRILLDMEFDQIVYEYGDDEQPAWIHVSYSKTHNRNEVLRAIKSKGKTKYLKTEVK